MVPLEGRFMKTWINNIFYGLGGLIVILSLINMLRSQQFDLTHLQTATMFSGLLFTIAANDSRFKFSESQMKIVAMIGIILLIVAIILAFLNF